LAKTPHYLQGLFDQERILGQEETRKDKKDPVQGEDPEREGQVDQEDHQEDLQLLQGRDTAALPQQSWPTKRMMATSQEKKEAGKNFTPTWILKQV